jgi:hypothetical protein
LNLRLSGSIPSALTTNPSKNAPLKHTPQDIQISLWPLCCCVVTTALKVLKDGT